jgi:hypothetical protein
MCPFNNNNTANSPRLTQADSVLCQVCFANSTADWDVRAGYYWVSLNWGPNMGPNGYAEDNDAYKVMMVDAKGNNYGEANGGDGKSRVHKHVLEFAAGSDCCPEEAYQIVVQGQMAPGATHFMIVPVKLAATGAAEEFSLPLGKMVPFTDITEGPAVTVFKATMTVQFADPTAFVAQGKKAEAIMSNAIAKSSEHLEPSMVSITSLAVDAGGRRLSENLRRLEENLRRLAAGGVIVNYQVIIPPGHALAGQGASAITASTFNTTALTSAIMSEATKMGMTVTVTGVVVAEVTAETITPDGPTDPVTGAASPMAGSVLSALLVVIAMLTGRQWLA